MNAPLPRVLFWTRITEQLKALPAALDQSAVELIVCHSEAEALAALPSVDAALLPGVAVSYSPELAQALGAAPRLRWIQLVATGREGLDALGAPAHVTITDVGTTAAAVVGEHAVALLLALARHIGPAALMTERATWTRNEVVQGMRSLEGMTLCVAGFGRIGKETARRAQAFGMDCIAVNRSGHNDAPELAREVFALTDLHDALNRSDAVAISLPASPATDGLFDASAWAACRRGALVTNVGRGTVIDTDSLVQALHSGQIGGAGLDVTEPEPLPDDHPLWSAPNVLITPHVGGSASRAGTQRLARLVEDNLRRFARGEPLLNVVDAPRWTTWPG